MPSEGLEPGAVAVVVDARALGATTSVTCVVVTSGSNGVTALRARATRLGTAQPRFAANGLLCAIDGRPAAPACDDSGPNGYRYWFYWLGGSSGSSPAAGRRVEDQTVDGWRFLDGGSAKSPETSSSFAGLTA